jgi:hypothetical protein
MGVVRDLPGVTVGIGEVAGVATPERLLCGLENGRPGLLRDIERAIDLRLRATFLASVTPPNPLPSDEMFASSASG